MSTAGPGDDGERSAAEPTPEDDAGEVWDRLRSAPAAEIVADVLSTLLSAAQVKLGRRDARLFIDLCAETVRYSRPHLPDELSEQVDTALGQLRLAQVAAENQVGRNQEPEPNDLTAIPRPPAGRDQGAAGSGEQPPSSALWVPGR